MNKSTITHLEQELKTRKIQDIISDMLLPSPIPSPKIVVEDVKIIVEEPTEIEKLTKMVKQMKHLFETERQQDKEKIQKLENQLARYKDMDIYLLELDERLLIHEITTNKKIERLEKELIITDTVGLVIDSDDDSEWDSDCKVLSATELLACYDE